MEFTGERFVPGSGCGALLEAEHVERYNFARSFVHDKSVLDIACGAGYGSRILLEAGAKKVTGVDVAAESVEFAQRNYSGDGIRFIQADAEQYCTGTYDVIVSFETIEHLNRRKQYLSHLFNMLSADGRLIISTPNKAINSPMKSPEEIKNHYHLYEYTEGEFIEELSSAGFTIITKFGQHLFPWIFSNQMISRLLRRRKFIVNSYCTAKTAGVLPIGHRTPKYFVYVVQK